MDQPFFTLTVLFILHGWPLFILTALTQEAILALSRGVWIGRERAASLGSGHEGRKSGCCCGRAGSGTPTVGLRGGLVGSVEGESAAQGRDGQVGRELQGCREADPRLPSRHRPQSCCPSADLPPLHDLPNPGTPDSFLLFPFHAVDQGWQHSLCLALALGACQGKVPLWGDQEKAQCYRLPSEASFSRAFMRVLRVDSQRRPSRFPGSLVPLLPEQPGGRVGHRVGHPTPGMCLASRTSLPGRGPLSLTLAYFPP